MSTTRQRVIALFVVVLSTPTAFAQQTEDPAHSEPGRVRAPITAKERAAVRRLLDAYHQTLPREVFLSASPSARVVLRDIAVSDDTSWLYRSRALHALGLYWPDDETFALLDAAVRSTDTPKDELHQVMLMHVDHFRARAAASVATHLDHEDVQVRLSAVEGLRRIALDAVARRALEEARAQEPVPLVRERIDNALKTLR